MSNDTEKLEHEVHGAVDAFEKLLKAVEPADHRPPRPVELLVMQRIRQ
jgi:hypothetical protein